MRNPTALVGLTMLALVASCGGSSSSALPGKGSLYPSAVRAQMVKSCDAEANSVSPIDTKDLHSYCTCALAYFEVHLSFADFKAADRAMSSFKAPKPNVADVFRNAAKTCRKKLVSEMASVPVMTVTLGKP